ncbi:Protein phosphatase PP2A regulatory subunit B [Perkinsus chesapeaki]|uniref:Protein phosphatase PP2A regulatory subunit B n=1 Tax=Perkinsus chesapeaki TaxID=330153 RepID=A0A7J6MGM4_PERCH|nr:Protein phosphatase PP2A regulatory subunit B [Perkinsus chesapeaki]
MRFAIGDVCWFFVGDREALVVCGLPTSANPSNPTPPTSQVPTAQPATAGGPPAGPGGNAAPTQQFASLYAGDLAPDVTEAILYEVFNAIGPVASIRVCRDSVTRKSLGYAYINFHNVADAERALDTLNYSPIKGRPCRLMWSHRDPALRRSGAGNVYVKNLDKNIDNKALYDTFSLFGNILSCKVALTPDGKSRGFGFVHFESDESAQAAIAKLDGMQIGEKTVYVAPFKKTAERSDGTPKNFTNVYIKHIPDSWSDEKIKEEFGKFGEITSFAIQVDPKGRRFAFVNYAEFEQARAAVEDMDGKDVRTDEEKAADKEQMERERAERKAAREAAKKEGEEEGPDDDIDSDDENEEPETAKLYVTRAQSKAERAAVLKEQFNAAKGGQGAGRFGGVNLYVKNLGENVDDAELKRMFEPFGTITSAKVMTDEKGVSRGFGFVCFSTHEEATKAVTDMHLKLIGGKPLYVGMHEKREQRLERLQQRYRAPQQMGGGGPGGFGGPRGPTYAVGGGQPGGGFGGAPGGGFNQPQPMYYSGGGMPRPGGPMGPGGFRGGAGGGMPGGGPQYGGPRGFGQQGGMMPGGGGGPRGPRGPPMGMGARGGPFGPMGVPGGGPNRGGMVAGGPPPRGPPMGMGMPTGRGGFPPQLQQQPLAGAAAAAGPPQQHHQPPLTAAGLAAAPPAVQKQMLGEQLFSQIQRIQPNLAGKITGMMLEMDNSELLILLESDSQLRAKVDEALMVLQAKQPRRLLDSKFGVPVASDSDYVHDVSFSYYGDKVAMCTSAQHILIWRVSEDGDDWVLEACIASAHNAPIWRLDWAYPEFGEIIASCSEDRVVSIWSCEEYDDDTRRTNEKGRNGAMTTRWRKRACLTDSSHAVTDIQFAPRRWGLKLASCSASGCVRTYEAMDPVNLATWVLEDVITVSRLRANSLNTAAAVAPVPTNIASGGGRWQERSCVVGCKDSTGRMVAAKDVAWAPNLCRPFDILVVCGASNLVCIFDCSIEGCLTLSQTLNLGVNAGPVWRVAWDLTGTILATAQEGGQVRIWYREGTREGKWVEDVKSRRSPAAAAVKR